MQSNEFIPYKLYVENTLFEQATTNVLNEGFNYFGKDTKDKLINIGKTNTLTNEDLIKYAYDLRLMLSALVYVKDPDKNSTLVKLRQSLLDFFKPEDVEVKSLGNKEATEKAVKTKTEKLSKETLDTIKGFLLKVIKYIPSLSSNQVVEISGNTVNDLKPEVKTINVKK